jgi:hypothetical protein
MRLTPVFLALAACARGGMDHHAVPDGPPDIDAPPPIDSPPPIDAASCPAPAGSGPHLLLSEITLTPAGSEFIEITNPTGATVDLSNYYLSDNGAYWRLPVATPNLGASDFVARFPLGATIPANGVVTVATGTAAAFMTAFGVMPTYSITDGTMPTVAMNGPPTLTNAGEIAVLFAWDGMAPLVQDVDMMLAGVPTAADGLISKSGMLQMACRYATDANTIAPQTSAPGAGRSTKRIALEASSETHGGGNGITGDDETSENTGNTWDTTASFTAPTPGTVPTALMQ